jgi:D-alanyl-D-alanine carboxypeptidase/D-alanyl-D-alanine carboxypeptidase (penicillin-binding protein 5/6)
MKLRDLLKALLISSANETAYIIAENLFPDNPQEFVDLMNKRAQELGATKTHFVNPCGMHDDKHITTARDLSTIARYAMTFKDFRDIVGSKDYQLEPTNKHNWGVLAASNKLFRYKSDYYDEVTGVKTGYTSQAGHNLVSSARNKDGMELMAVVMGVKVINSDKDVYHSSKDLLEYGFKNFAIQRVADSGQLVKSVPVIDAEDSSSLDLVTQKEFKSVLPLDTSKWNIIKI